VIGFKPTYGRISRAGVIPLSPSLDHVGFFTSSVEMANQAAPVLMSGWTPWTSDREPVLAVPEGPLLQDVSLEGRAHFNTACEALSAHYAVRTVPALSDFQEIRSRHNVILSAEAARVHAEWFGKYADLYSSKFVELIRCGQSIAARQLEGALEARGKFREDLLQFMNDDGIDLWICPSTIGPAPKGLSSTGDPVMNLPWTQAGLPAMNLPSGKSENGLPLGLQLIGGWNMDEALLSWAEGIRKAVDSL
jgi:Asp-tRNA(Asn)/Glu-tRNA(Gln) amidotransferase A subunit family amidase